MILESLSSPEMVDLPEYETGDDLAWWLQRSAECLEKSLKFYARPVYGDKVERSSNGSWSRS